MKRTFTTRSLPTGIASLGLALCVVCVPCHGEPPESPHSFYSDVVLSAEGRSVSGASVLVYKAGTKQKAKLFRRGTTKSAISIEDFDQADHAKWLETKEGPSWYVSGGANFIRPRAAINGGKPNSGDYGLMTYGGNDAPSHTPNVECTWYNKESLCGMAWGPFFKVKDDTASIALHINGGKNALDAKSITSGGTGVALWDVDAARILPDTFVSGTNNWNYTAASIPLKGLRGKTVGIVVIDHDNAGWAFTGVDSIAAPERSIEMSGQAHHRVVQAWEFDSGKSDLKQWSGDTGIFRVGGIAAINYYINLQGRPRRLPASGQLDFDKANEPGWLDSRNRGSEAKGSIRSKTFTVQGDIIEFYIGGTADGSVHFDLVRASDDRVLFSTHYDAKNLVNTMGHAFWSVKKNEGDKVYLKIVDNNAAGGYIALDAVRMVDFDDAQKTRPRPAPQKVIYTQNKDAYVEQQNPVLADKNGRVRFFVVGGDYDLHVTGGPAKYTLADVTIVNPFAPHTIESSTNIPPLTLVERAKKTRGGNNAMLFDRPGSTDGNNASTPYRIIVNKGECGWALTYNVDWDEIGKKWTKRDISNRTMFMRINGETHALEYGNDSRTSAAPPVMETVFRLSPTGNFWVKSQEGPNGVSMVVKNNVSINGKKVTLRMGDVVVLDPEKPFSVIAPRKYADLNPVVVRAVDPNDPSRVHVLVAGKARVNAIPGSVEKGGDRLVTEGKDSLRAKVAPDDVDPRAVLGRMQGAYNGLFIIIP
jgi:hypothetical protein